MIFFKILFNIFSTLLLVQQGFSSSFPDWINMVTPYSPQIYQQPTVTNNYRSPWLTGKYFPNKNALDLPANSTKNLNERTQHMINILNGKLQKLLQVAKKPTNVEVMIKFPKVMEEQLPSLFHHINLRSSPSEFKELTKLFIRCLLYVLRSEIDKSENAEFLPIVQDQINKIPIKRPILYRKTRRAARFPYPNFQETNSGVPISGDQDSHSQPTSSQSKSESLSPSNAVNSSVDKIESLASSGGDSSGKETKVKETTGNTETHPTFESTNETSNPSAAVDNQTPLVESAHRNLESNIISGDNNQNTKINSDYKSNENLESSQPVSKPLEPIESEAVNSGIVNSNNLQPGEIVTQATQ